MPQQTDAARRVSVDMVDDTPDGQKIRVAGRVLAYDVLTGIAVLGGRTRRGVLVDVALCMGDEGAAAWAQERRAMVMVVGRVERCEAAVEVPRGAGGVEVDARRVVRGVLVVGAAELDLGLWDAVAGEATGDGRMYDV